MYKVSLAWLLPLMSYTTSCVFIIMYCLGLILVIMVNLIMYKIKYLQSLRNIDMYLITNFRDSMLYGF